VQSNRLHLTRVVLGAWTITTPVADIGAFEFQLSSCYADFNADGTVNVLDFVAFQLAWQAGNLAADCDADAELTLLDFVCFQAAFAAGCPG